MALGNTRGKTSERTQTAQTLELCVEGARAMLGEVTALSHISVCATTTRYNDIEV